MRLVIGSGKCPVVERLWHAYEANRTWLNAQTDFVEACKAGQLEVAKLLYRLDELTPVTAADVIASYRAITAIEKGNYRGVDWLTKDILREFSPRQIEAWLKAGRSEVTFGYYHARLDPNFKEQS